MFKNAACTTPATNGYTGTAYVEISAVPFDQDSGTNNIIRIEANDTAGNQGIQASGFNILIDTVPPTFISVFLYGNATWATNETPSVICCFSIPNNVAGFNQSTAQFAFSITSAAIPTNWAAITQVYTNAACTILASNNATGILYMEIVNVPFNYDTALYNNTIRFRVNDTAGNMMLQSSATIIPTDSIPPNGFTMVSPTVSWSNTLNPVIIISFNAGAVNSSGLNNGSVEYAYSITGSATPSNWAPVTGVFTDSGCTIPAVNGTFGVVYVEIPTISFVESGTANYVRISALDIAGNNGTQAYLIKTDVTAPNTFTLYSPTSYVNSLTPTIIISVNAGASGTSGINNSSALFAYSTAGNTNPGNWAAVIGVYTTAACTTLAPNGTTVHFTLK